MQNDKYGRNILKKVRFRLLRGFQEIFDDEFQIKRDWSVEKEFYLLVTSRVKEETRAHFDCPDLEGAELHNNERYIGNRKQLN